MVALLLKQRISSRVMAQAALMSEMVTGSSFISSPRDVGKATSLRLGDLL